MEKKELLERAIQMLFHSKRKKVGSFMKANINMFYSFGVRPETLAKWFKISRATVYRHIEK